MNLIIWINNKILKNVIDTNRNNKRSTRDTFQNRRSGKLLLGHFNFEHVQYTFDRTKEEDFDLSKHNGSEPLVAMTVIWRKDETFKCGRQYRQWRLDVSNLWKIFFSTRESRSPFFDFFQTKNIFDNAQKNFCVFFRAIVNFQNLFLF